MPPATFPGIVEGDTLTEIIFQLRQSDGTPPDLTGVSGATAKYRIAGGAEHEVALTLISPATLGQVKFRPVSGDLNAFGTAKGRVFLPSGGFTGKTFNFIFEVEDDEV